MKFFTLMACLFTQLSIASDSTDEIWKTTLQKNSITNLDQQSYCFTNKKGEVEGQNIDLQVRLASVSKILTSLWALETLGASFRYETKFTIKNKTLHISGSLDPFFGNEKMFYLLSQLNELGYKEFDKITFDKNLIVYPLAQKHTDIYPSLSPTTTTKHLNMYFNTSTWGKAFRAEYDRIASLSAEGKFKDTVNFKVTEVQYSEVNPLETDPEAKVLTYTSPELGKYLKEINIQSNNYASHTIWLQLGGEEAFSNFLATNYDLKDDKIHFYTGSGLPSYNTGARKDNYATCAVVLKLMSEIKESIIRQNREMEDIIAVPGSDGGTFRNRVFSSDLKNSFVAKTGTLTHVATLAGIMSAKDGYSFFGVFNQNPSIIGAKKTQNIMVEAIMEYLGGPSAFNYTFEKFHTYNTSEIIKNLFLEENNTSDFMPFEDELN